MPAPLIVVTGAAGRLGVNVHRVLLEAGKNVRAVDRMRGIAPSGPLIRADLRRERDCRRAVRDAAVLVHLAFRPDPRGHPSSVFDEQMLMNRRLFEAAIEAGVRKIIFASTIQVIASQKDPPAGLVRPHYLPMDEHSPVEPDNWYSLGKRCTEEMLATLHLSDGVDSVAVRFPTLLHVVPPYLSERSKGHYREAFAYLSYCDAANLVLKLVDADLPGCRIYFPASRGTRNGRPLPELIREFYSQVPLRRPVEEMDGLIDLSTLQREVGWEPREVSQPDPVPPLPWTERLRKRVVKLLPHALKAGLRRAFRFVTGKKPGQ